MIKGAGNICLLSLKADKLLVIAIEVVVYIIDTRKEVIMIGFAK
jgi:hypothetical protein